MFGDGLLQWSLESGVLHCRQDDQGRVTHMENSYCLLSKCSCQHMKEDGSLKFREKVQLKRIMEIRELHKSEGFLKLFSSSFQKHYTFLERSIFLLSEYFFNYIHGMLSWMFQIFQYVLYIYLQCAWF